jgi:hypothetical protein
MESLNIVQLIEKNSITRLSKDYENRLITKIKDNFTDNQQHLFVASFYCFLNYDSKKDFIVDFDNVWKWLGFSRKDPAKRLLEKHFVIDIDYQVGNNFPPIGGKFENEKGDIGRPSETILLTINTFKKFCLKAGTKKADDIHDYYIKLEELLQQTVNEETDELKKQLLYKENENIKLLNQNKQLSKNIVRRNINKYKSGNCVYFISSSEINDKFKIGSTSNINNRISDLSTASPYYFEIIELFYTEFHILLEKTIKEIFAKHRISVNCEWYKLEVIEDIKNFIQRQIEIYNDFKNFSNVNLLKDSCENNIFDDIISDVVDNDIDNNNTTKDENKYIILDGIICSCCNQKLNKKNFFFADKKNRIYLDICISCYEQENGESKQCNQCENIKNKFEFVIDVSKKDGLTYECKTCRYEINNKRKEKIREENPNIGKINCETCENFQDLKMFYKFIDNENQITYSKQCKKCYCDENGPSKQCFTCKQIKNNSEFDKTLANTDGLACYCKSCRQIERDTKKMEKKKTEDPNKNKKQCIKCEEYFKQNSFFKKYDENGDMLSYYEECMNCVGPELLQCSKCCEIKENIHYSKDSSKKTGYRTICKKCINK